MDIYPPLYNLQSLIMSKPTSQQIKEALKIYTDSIARKSIIDNSVNTHNLILTTKALSNSIDGGDSASIYDNQ